MPYIGDQAHLEPTRVLVKATRNLAKLHCEAPMRVSDEFQCDLIRTRFILMMSRYSLMKFVMPFTDF